MPPRNEKSQLKRPRVCHPSVSASPQSKKVSSSPPPSTSQRTVPAKTFTLHMFKLNPFKAILTLFKGSLPEDATDSKKPRRSDRLSSQLVDKTPVSHKQQLPSPVTRGDTHEIADDESATPGAKTDDDTPRKADDNWSQNPALSSPPQDTQPMSQYHDRNAVFSDEVEDEVAEGVWGYLLPLGESDKPIVLKKRSACPLPDSIKAAANGSVRKPGDNRPSTIRDEEQYEQTKIKGVPSGGYLIGRHPECGTQSQLFLLCNC